jgi:hypothetical protein
MAGRVLKKYWTTDGRPDRGPAWYWHGIRGGRWKCRTRARWIGHTGPTAAWCVSVDADYGNIAADSADLDALHYHSAAAAIAAARQDGARRVGRAITTLHYLRLAREVRHR